MSIDDLRSYFRFKTSSWKMKANNTYKQVQKLAEKS